VLCLVDDKNIDWVFGRIQSQPELFPYGNED